MPVLIMFCCNDWRNGNCLGQADSFELFGCEIEGGAPIRIDYKPKKLPGSNVADGDHTLIFGRLKIPCISWSSWVGNWCWDAAKVRHVHAVECWNYLVARKDYQCVHGPEKLFEGFNQHKRMRVKLRGVDDAAIKGGLAK